MKAWQLATVVLLLTVVVTGPPEDERVVLARRVVVEVADVPGRGGHLDLDDKGREVGAQDQRGLGVVDHAPHIGHADRGRLERLCMVNDLIRFDDRGRIAEGLLVVRPGVGTLVASPPRQPDDLREQILEGDAERLVIESRAAGLPLRSLLAAIRRHWIGTVRRAS